MDKYAARALGSIILKRVTRFSRFLEVGECFARAFGKYDSEDSYGLSKTLRATPPPLAKSTESGKTTKAICHARGLS